MTDSIVQFGLLAQDDASEWMNILFIIVVAVFWAIGGLLKAASANKNRQGGRRPSGPTSGQPKRETWLQQLAKKAEEIQRSIEAEGGKEPAKRPPARPAESRRPPEGRVTVRTRQDGTSVMVYERQTAPTPAEKRLRPAPAAPTPQPVPQMSRRPSVELPEAPVPAPQPIPAPARRAKKPAAPADVAAPLIDYSDPDALKRAILQYEILGKPLALRNPFERASGF